MVDAVVADVVLDHRHAVGVAEELVILGDGSLAITLGSAYQLFNVEALINAAPLAHIGSNLDIGHLLTLRTCNPIDHLDGAQSGRGGVLRGTIDVQRV
jgi:hypothetical protein